MGKRLEGSMFSNHPQPQQACRANKEQSTVLCLSITGFSHGQGPVFAKHTHIKMNYLTLNIARVMRMNKWHSIWRQNVTRGFLFLPAFLVEVLEDRGPQQRVTLRSQSGGICRVQTFPTTVLWSSTPTQSPRHQGKTHTWSSIRAASWAVCSRGVSVRVYFDLVSFQFFRYLI